RVCVVGRRIPRARGHFACGFYRRIPPPSVVVQRGSKVTPSGHRQTRLRVVADGSRGPRRGSPLTHPGWHPGPALRALDPPVPVASVAEARQVFAVPSNTRTSTTV